MQLRLCGELNEIFSISTLQVARCAANRWPTLLRHGRSLRAALARDTAHAEVGAREAGCDGEQTTDDGKGANKATRQPNQGQPHRAEVAAAGAAALPKYKSPAAAAALGTHLQSTRTPVSHSMR